MTLTQLQCLVALAKLGSFTEAAVQMNLTQSAVSHALTAFENELNITLIVRNRKGIITFTPVGKRILEYARSIVSYAEAIVQEAKAEQGEITGKLRIGYIPFIHAGMLARIITVFQERYPNVEVVLFEGTLLEIEDWLSQNIIDAGFSLHSSVEKNSTLILTDELCVLVPSGHHLKERGSIALSELGAEHFILSKDECSFDIINQSGPEKEKINPHVRFRVQDSATIFAMVQEGLGITLLPRMMLSNNLEGTTILSLDPPHLLPIGMVVKSQQRSSPAVQAFIDVVSMLATMGKDRGEL
ncbi:DNA-binding transcriptional regulator, LysR family [Paenibacillus algorifonticola]|uniref:DNA-binding transcriptional regulator, LysR family n=1 Tax=Paenibacillus algorifonticola TaxID=684063 RepID=A0A1I2CSM7_9BACL|nr:LysR family transcriptional regulator [Paenibacillus algorifonticola]SFE71321.1 DNA-binding transcriptional regulator, LysR family [Paenibacillus algorifonticola]